ncbi:BQ2448_1216 [Microbotryum intermedium]|uniref:BQ2448_1216 protein n=1 Tax=Microbotryum intermedium TaxID=269621 RepID=A0A238F7I6_9BASI|nr:BQ2448_1216 [Microbotryum intermedium]
MTVTRERIDALSLLKQLEHDQELASTRKSSTPLQDHVAWAKANTTSRPSTPTPYLDFLAPSIPLPPPLPSTSIVLPHLSSQDRRASIATSSASVAASPRQAPPAFQDHTNNMPSQLQHLSPSLLATTSLSPSVTHSLTPPEPPSSHRRRSSSIDDYSPDDYSVKKPRSYSESSERYNGLQDQSRSYSPYQPDSTEEYRPSYDESSFDTTPVSLAPPRGHLSNASFDSPVVPLPQPTIRIEGEEPNEEDEDDEARFGISHNRYPTPPHMEDEDEIDEESGIGAPAPPPVKGKKTPVAPPTKPNAGPMTSTPPPSSISAASSTVRHRSIIPSLGRKKTPAQELGLTSASSIAGSSLGAATTSSDLLSHHHDLQSELLTELTTLSSRLKTSTQTFSENLEKDKEVMETAKDHLEKNADKMSKERGRLTAVKKKTRGTTCWTIGVVAAVAAAWATMFFLIKLT